MSNLWLPPFYKKTLLGGNSLPPQMNLLAGQSDTFQRPNGALTSTVWAPTGDSGGSSVITGDELFGSTAGANSGNFRLDSANFPSNQYSQVLIGSATLASGETVAASVRNQDANNCYLVIYQNNAGTYQLSLFNKVAGGYGQLLSINLAGPVAIGTPLVCIAEGNVISAYLGSNATPGSSLAVVDGTFVGGTPGLGFFGATSPITAWSGGRAATGPFAKTIATDNFNRANGLVSAGQPNWTDLNATFSGVACNGASIVSNLVSAPAAQHYADFRNETYSNDQWAQIGKGTVTPSGGPFNMGILRWNGSSCYIGGLFDGGVAPAIQVYLVLAGSASTLAASCATNATAYATGVTYVAAANGTRISVRVNNSEVLSTTDNTRTVGQPGFMLFGVTDAENFAAGNVHT